MHIVLTDPLPSHHQSLENFTDFPKGRCERSTHRLTHISWRCSPILMNFRPRHPASLLYVWLHLLLPPVNMILHTISCRVQTRRVPFRSSPRPLASPAPSVLFVSNRTFTITSYNFKIMFNSYHSCIVAGKNGSISVSFTLSDSESY